MQNKHAVITFVTSDISTILVDGIFQAQIDAGYYPVFCCASGSRIPHFLCRNPVKYFPIIIKRQPSIVFDIISFFHFSYIVWRIKPYAICYGTPKAAFIGALVSRLFLVKKRIYILHGFRYESFSGVARKVLVSIEKLICRLSTHILPVSRSLVNLGYIDCVFPSDNARVVKVLGAGSCGIAMEQFTPVSIAYKNRLRELHHISSDAFVILYVGRLVPRKGIVDLLKAYYLLRNSLCGDDKLYLLLVGDFDRRQPLPAGIEKLVKSGSDNIIFYDFTDHVAPYYQLADLLCVPSHWEGFGNVAVEASACALPVVGTAVTGLSDAIADSESGILVNSHSPLSIYKAIKFYYSNPGLRASHGSRGLDWAKLFDRVLYAKSLANFIDQA